ncbi:MAG: PP2C family protein-serine/threonine phosphatase [Bryobacteraceae bacterium]
MSLTPTEAASLQARVHILFEDLESLGAQISRLNRSIAANCPGNWFITLFAGVLHPATGHLAYCNAGHNAPLLLRSGAGVESLEATGLPLGIRPDVTYEEKSCHLEQDDVLVLFSDGVTEACAPDEDAEFGEERLIAVVQGKRNYPAASLIEAINAEVRSFACGLPATDDITLVLVRRC